MFLMMERLKITKLKGWDAVIRDTIMMIVIAIAGFLAVPVLFGSNPPRYVLGIFNILLGIIGFCISGCMIADNRWRHLNKVAMTICLIVSSIVIISMLIPFRFELLRVSIGIIVINILISTIVVYIMMALGGSLSFIFVKADRKN